MVITLQYLEDAPELDQLDETAVVEKLRRAADSLLITHLLIGWHLPPRLLAACRQEADRTGMRFIRWHPLLTGDGVFQPRQPWQVVNLHTFATQLYCYEEVGNGYAAQDTTQSTFGTIHALKFDANGRPHITFYNPDDKSLHYLTRAIPFRGIVKPASIEVVAH